MSDFAQLVRDCWEASEQLYEELRAQVEEGFATWVGTNLLLDRLKETAQDCAELVSHLESPLI